ncbi:MAG: type II/IV secretion system ATPase subunit, partial [Candidatus Hadarchaeota archaeon]|nr:type II/IV secretion system ATPase subunit [Candidatus Hadarchaeota archaeon]
MISRVKKIGRAPTSKGVKKKRGGKIGEAAPKKKIRKRGVKGKAARKKEKVTLKTINKKTPKIGKGITPRKKLREKGKALAPKKIPKRKIAKPKIAKKTPKIGKSAFKALEDDTVLADLQKKIATEAEAAEGFEAYTTFTLPEGYKEDKRYWVAKPYTWVNVLFDPKENEYFYYLVEPSLTPPEKAALELLHEHLLDRLSYDESMKDRDRVLKEKVDELLGEYDIPLDEESVGKLLYYLKRKYIGYGKIDAFLKDPGIEDVSCDGLGKPIFLYHQDYQNIRTNITYEDAIELDLFVGRLVERAGKQISLGRPTVDATLPQGYRLQATLGKEVTTRGSTFTIRKYREEPFTPVDLIKFRTFSPEMLAYLWLATENKKSIVVIGGTASGKTCTLNALSLFMPPDAKIISIEDTRELSLYQENWVASVTRHAYGEKAITMYDLLAQALRQRPEIIVVGEVRGPEALSLFQAMTTGHTSYSTMHAGSMREMVHRLEGEPINVPHHMLAS